MTGSNSFCACSKRTVKKHFKWIRNVILEKFQDDCLNTMSDFSEFLLLLMVMLVTGNYKDGAKRIFMIKFKLVNLRMRDFCE